MVLGKYLSKLLSCLKISKEDSLRRKGVKIGNNCSIGGCFVGSEPYLIEIGDNVQITDGVRIFTHSGGWVLRKEIPDFDTFGKVKIGTNVYIGNNALIMPGVNIGDNVIIGAGSIVTKSINNGSVVAGNPARVISTIEEFKQKYSKFNFHTKGMSLKKKKETILNSPNKLFINR